jgi:hypothetical protein
VCAWAGVTTGTLLVPSTEAATKIFVSFVIVILSSVLFA